MRMADGDYVSSDFLLKIIDDFKNRIAENARIIDQWHTQEDEKTLEFRIVFKDKVNA